MTIQYLVVRTAKTYELSQLSGVQVCSTCGYAYTVLQGAPGLLNYDSLMALVNYAAKDGLKVYLTNQAPNHNRTSWGWMTVVEARDVQMAVQPAITENPSVTAYLLKMVLAEAADVYTAECNLKAQTKIRLAAESREERAIERTRRTEKEIAVLADALAQAVLENAILDARVTYLLRVYGQFLVDVLANLKTQKDKGGEFNEAILKMTVAALKEWARFV